MNDEPSLVAMNHRGNFDFNETRKHLSYMKNGTRDAWTVV